MSDPVLAGVRLVLKAVEHVPDTDLPPELLELRKADRGDPDPMDPTIRDLIVKRLKRDIALRRYGQHLPGCEAPGGNCSCGWDATRKELVRDLAYLAAGGPS